MCNRKGAIGSFTEALAKEIYPAWNIKVSDGLCANSLIAIIWTDVFQQITLTEFRTKGVRENATVLPHHPAYTNDALPTNLLRRFVTVGDAAGDPDKAALAFVKIAGLEDPPFRFPIHKDAIATARFKAAALNEAADKWES